MIKIFKIGEFSKLVRVSARMLRHYEKCGLLSPAEVDKFTGYRMYSAEQIPLLMRIIELRDMGFNVEEIEETLPYYDNAEFMQKSLENKQNQIKDIIATQQFRLDKIASMSGQINKGAEKILYEVVLKEIPAIKVISLREIIATPEDEPEQWEKIWTFINQNSIKCSKTGYSIYYDEEYKDECVDLEIAVPVEAFGENKEGFEYKELGQILQAVTIQFPGPYSNYNKAMQKLAMWVQQNNYQFAGLIRGHGIIMPGDGVAFDETLTELQVPIRKI